MSNKERRPHFRLLSPIWSGAFTVSMAYLIACCFEQRSIDRTHQPNATTDQTPFENVFSFSFSRFFVFLIFRIFARNLRIIMKFFIQSLHTRNESSLAAIHQALPSVPFVRVRWQRQRSQRWCSCWVDPVQGKVRSVQTSSSTWVGSICPRVTCSELSAIPGPRMRS